MRDGVVRPMGVVLAGGESRRYGRDKARVSLAGRPMAAWAATALRAHAEPLLLVGGDEALASSLELEAVADLRPGRGPLAGLEAALERARDGGSPGVFVLACDLPLVSGTLVDLILREAGDGTRAVVPEAPGRLGVQPLSAYYPVSALARVRRGLDAGPSSMGAFLAGLYPRRLSRERIAEVGDPDELFLNVNTPEDRERARMILDGRPAATASPDPGGRADR